MPPLDRVHNFESKSKTVIASKEVDEEFNQLVNGNNENYQQIDLILNDNLTLSGTKTFASYPVLPATDPTNENHPITKKYLDSRIAAPDITPAGVMVPYVANVAPTGWLLCDGKTIGGQTSTATARANADTLDLYTVLWNNTDNAEIQLKDTSGANINRGTSASADFTAGRVISLPDRRGRASFGKDNMGGAAAGRITDPAASKTLGTFGTQTKTIAVENLPPHSHTVSKYGGLGNVQGGSSSNIWQGDVTTTTGTTGSGTPLNILPPGISDNWIIKL